MSILVLMGMAVWVVYAISVVGLMATAAKGQTHCHPAEARSTKLWYVPAGENTAVLLIAYCDGTAATPWAISFFEGEQPSLWDWWEFQNTASELLRGW